MGTTVQSQIRFKYTQFDFDHKQLALSTSGDSWDSYFEDDIQFSFSAGGLQLLPASAYLQPPQKRQQQQQQYYSQLCLNELALQQHELEVAAAWQTNDRVNRRQHTLWLEDLWGPPLGANDVASILPVGEQAADQVSQF